MIQVSESPLKIELDERDDEVIIEGTRYSCELFRNLGKLGLPVGRLIRIEGRRADGTLVLRQYVPGDQVTA